MFTLKNKQLYKNLLSGADHRCAYIATKMFIPLTGKESGRVQMWVGWLWFTVDFMS